MKDTRALIKREIEGAVKALGLEIDRVILFGSRARGDSSQDSDWDILIVVRGELDIDGKRRLAKLLREKLADSLIDLDVIIKTLEEFELFKDLLGTVTREACKEGVLL